MFIHYHLNWQTPKKSYSDDGRCVTSDSSMQHSETTFPSSLQKIVKYPEECWDVFSSLRGSDLQLGLSLKQFLLIADFHGFW